VGLLHIVSELGCDILFRNLTENCTVDMDVKDDLGRTPLSCAADGGHLNIVKQLIENSGVDLNSWGRYGRTPLLWAVKGHLEVVKLLLSCDGY
jgi:ankyrin repeat protein